MVFINESNESTICIDINPASVVDNVCLQQSTATAIDEGAVHFLKIWKLVIVVYNIF